MLPWLDRSLVRSWRGGVRAFCFAAQGCGSWVLVGLLGGLECRGTAGFEGAAVLWL